MAVDDWPPPEQLADRLARLRRALDVDNDAIAEAAGIESVGTVSKWLAGQEPKGSVLLALARYFGVTVEFLLEGKVEPGWVKPQIVRTPKPPRVAGQKGREAPATSKTAAKKRRQRKA